MRAPGGLLVMSTPNGTPHSYAVLIVGAERVARTIQGAHDWSRLVTPDALSAKSRSAGSSARGVTGMTWRPGSGFVLGSDTSVNYYLTAVPA
ncbi:MAG: hypothetical protein ACRYG4_25765 [Janthinobacterium lividum]